MKSAKLNMSGLPCSSGTPRCAIRRDSARIRCAARAFSGVLHSDKGDKSDVGDVAKELAAVESPTYPKIATAAAELLAGIENLRHLPVVIVQGMADPLRRTLSSVSDDVPILATTIMGRMRLSPVRSRRSAGRCAPCPPTTRRPGLRKTKGSTAAR